MALTDKWHGAPVWVWAAGGTVAAAGAVYLYKKHKASSTSTASAAPSIGPSDTSGDGGFPFGGGGSGGPLGNLGDLVGSFVPPVPPVDTTTPEATSPSTVADAVKQVIATITPAPAATPTPTPAPVPAPPPVLASVLPGNWQANDNLPPAPTGYTATPIVNTGTVVGENLTDNSQQVQVTAPWQQAIGLAPADVGTTATPIITQGQTIGESFTGQSVNPAPPALFTNNPPQGINTPFGLVTQAQYDLLKATGRI